MRRTLPTHFKLDGSPKRSLPDRVAADEFAKKQNGSGPRRYHAYECDFCGHWHIGSGKPKGRKKTKARA